MGNKLTAVPARHMVLYQLFLKCLPNGDQNWVGFTKIKANKNQQINKKSSTVRIPEI